MWINGPGPTTQHLSEDRATALMPQRGPADLGEAAISLTALGIFHVFLYMRSLPQHFSSFAFFAWCHILPMYVSRAPPFVLEVIRGDSIIAGATHFGDLSVYAQLLVG